MTKELCTCGQCATTGAAWPGNVVVRAHPGGDLLTPEERADVEAHRKWGWYPGGLVHRLYAILDRLAPSVCSPHVNSDETSRAPGDDHA